MSGRLLISGGAGYLGAELVRQAAAQGWEVVATYFARRPSDSLARYLRLDIRDEPAVERACAGIRPDLVIHTAFRQDGPDMWSTTVEGAVAVARVARQAGARLIHLSSDAIFDGQRAGA